MVGGRFDDGDGVADTAYGVLGLGQDRGVGRIGGAAGVEAVGDLVDVAADPGDLGSQGDKFVDEVIAGGTPAGRGWVPSTNAMTTAPTRWAPAISMAFALALMASCSVRL
jgi:hypothetical protein